MSMDALTQRLKRLAEVQERVHQALEALELYFQEHGCVSYELIQELSNAQEAHEEVWRQ